MFKFFSALIVIGCAAAFFTTPSAEQSKQMLGAQIMQAVAAQNVSLENGAAGNALLIGCKLRPSDCASLITSQLKTEHTDYKLFSTFSASGFGRKAWCIGAFTTLSCPGGFAEE